MNQPRHANTPELETDTRIINRPLQDHRGWSYTGIWYLDPDRPTYPSRTAFYAITDGIIEQVTDESPFIWSYANERDIAQYLLQAKAPQDLNTDQAVLYISHYTHNPNEKAIRDGIQLYKEEKYIFLQEAEAIRKAMGNNWRVSASGGRLNTFTLTAGIYMIVLNFDYFDGKDRVKAYAKYCKDFNGNSHVTNNRYIEITMTRKKSATQIARDINRRLWPTLKEAADEAANKIVARNNEILAIEGEDNLIASIMDSVPKSPMHQTRARGYKRTITTQQEHGMKITASRGGGRTIDISLTAVPFEEGLNIIEMLLPVQRYNAKIATEKAKIIRAEFEAERAKQWKAQQEAKAQATV